MGAMSLFDSIDDGPVFDDRPRIDERRAGQEDQAGLREGDARPLRQRPPADGRRVGPAARAPTAPWPRSSAARRRRSARVGGVVTGLQRKWTKRGDLMAVFQLEDLRGAIEVMVFPKTMTEHGHKLEDDAIVIVRGRVDRKEDTAQVMAMELERFEPVADVARRSPSTSPARRSTTTSCAGSRASCRTTPATPRSSCSWATASACAWPTTSASTPATASWPSCGCSWGPTRSVRSERSSERQDSPKNVRCRSELRDRAAGAGLEGSDPTVSGGFFRSHGYQVDTKDCTALGDAELAEMADICADGPAGYEIGFLSKAGRGLGPGQPGPRTATRSRASRSARSSASAAPRACSSAWPRSSGRSKRDAVLRALMADQYRRAVHGLPRRGRARRHPLRRRVAASRRSRNLERHRPPARATRPRARSGPGAVAWPSASASRPATTTTARSWPRATSASRPCSTTRR